MFKIKLEDISLLKESFQSISGLVNDVQIEIDDDGLRVSAIDTSHITFIHLSLNKESFESFEYDKPQKINLDCGEFMTFLKRASKDTTMMELDCDGQYLTIKYNAKVNKTFKLKLFDVEGYVPELPEIPFVSRVNISSSLFKEIVSDISTFSEKLRISNENDKIVFDAYGDYVDATIEYDPGEKLDDCNSIFSLDKIREMMKASKFAQSCWLNYGEDVPLMLEYSGDSGVLKFLLAPRIEDDV